MFIHGGWQPDFLVSAHDAPVSDHGLDHVEGSHRHANAHVHGRRGTGRRCRNAEVIRWIEAGTPADPGDYRSVTLDGVTSPKADGVAFTTAGTEANCVTNSYADGALALPDQARGPAATSARLPVGVEERLGWTFPAAGVDVGSPHGDPGPFIEGSGRELPSGQSLAFGDYRCRADPAGLFCVDYAHQTAVKLASGGVEGFGCLQKTTPPPEIGLRLSC